MVADVLSKINQQYLRAPSSVAEEVVPDAIDLPTTAGTLYIGDYSFGSEKEQYDDPAGLVMPQAMWGAIPKPCHRISPTDEAIMAERLLSCGMAGIIPEKELAQHNCRPMVRVFAGSPPRRRP